MEVFTTLLIINRLLSIISSGHNFGSSQVRLDEETEGCHQLGKTVAYLESAVLLQLLGEYSLRTTHRSHWAMSAVAFLSVSMG